MPTPKRLQSLLPKRKGPGHRRTYTETYRAEQLVHALKSLPTESLNDAQNELDEAIAQERASLEQSTETPLPQNLLKGRLLGSGGFGAVWLATDVPTGRQFALKQMRKAHVAGGSFGERVLDEKEAHESMTHPFIIKLFCTFQDESNLYFLLELATGGDLYEALQANEGRFTEDWARFYLGAVCLGLRHMHYLGFVYRDLKPENILLDSNGFAKMADLGFAKKMKTNGSPATSVNGFPRDDDEVSQVARADSQGRLPKISQRGRSYTMLGTEIYYPPEVVMGRGRTQAADWWSVGVLLHEMIVGRPPFGEKESMDLEEELEAYAHGEKDANERLKTELLLEAGVSESAADLVANFLKEQESERLGCNELGFRNIQQHAWFNPLDWVKLLRREIQPPYVPKSVAAVEEKRRIDYFYYHAVDQAIFQDRPYDRVRW
eukprot:CAMPEP_0119310234 /NCGR_PEP_ID=MMETSP1333-20130426/18312_1 /TAXON_ID=418940 /ORGANISM="Scyphosphaera apsteinii, Strain RCC1455" /LENGTH=433 /DNA_ID=CAMNT_0007314385 /DNA_START=115 /DNA_END=1413 /DNA_ORIENTATION=+